MPGGQQIVPGGQHPIAKNLVGTLTPSTMAKKSKMLPGNEVQPYSVTSLNALNYLTQQHDKSFDPLSAAYLDTRSLQRVQKRDN